jgi:hypothetical protein
MSAVGIRTWKHAFLVAGSIEGVYPVGDDGVCPAEEPMERAYLSLLSPGGRGVHASIRASIRTVQRD